MSVATQARIETLGGVTFLEGPLVIEDDVRQLLSLAREIRGQNGTGDSEHVASALENQALFVHLGRSMGVEEAYAQVYQ